MLRDDIQGGIVSEYSFLPKQGMVLYFLTARAVSIFINELLHMDKKNQLIDIATELFAERSYDNTPLSIICETANVSKGLISHHFGSKDGLLREIFMKKTEEMINIDTEKHTTPQEQLVALLEIYFLQLNNDKQFFQLMLNLILNPKTREILRDLIAKRSSFAHEMIQNIFKEIDPKNAQVLRYMFIAELDGVTINYLYEDFPLQEVKNHLINKYKNIKTCSSK